MYDDMILDLKNRSQYVYEYVLDLSKKYFPQKCCESKLYFDLKDSDKIGGKCWYEKGEDHVEMNMGVIKSYMKYFQDVLKVETISVLHTFLPNKDEEELDKCSFEGIVYCEGQQIMFDSKYISEMEIKILEIFVSRFIFLHELGHLFNGHCELVKANKENKMTFIPMYYNEDINNQIDEKKALDIRTLEMDADAFAATQSFLHLIFLYKNFDTEVKIKTMKPIDIFYWWSFAITSQFLVCEDECWKEGIYNPNYYAMTMQHLPCKERWLLVMSSVIDMSDSLNASRKEIKRIQKKMSFGALDAECTFNKLKFTNSTWMTDTKTNKESEKYCNDVHDNWKSVRNQLKEYTRLPLYKKEIK